VAGSSRGNPLAEDLDHVLAHTRGLWEEVRGRRLFITGGTGFFGCWLLESFCRANDQLGLGASALVLTRDPESFRRKAPHLAVHPAIQLHAGDIRSFAFPAGEFPFVIHAAAEPGGKGHREDPLLVLDTMTEGTRRTLEFARTHGARKLLLTSSGAVYGPQPPGMTLMPEDYGGASSTVDPLSAYSQGKRVAEFLCACYAGQYGLEAKIARCFAFLGPYLPLDLHYAAGNFIRDALAGGPIRVEGDGTPCRSYLYAADLAIWLWTILFSGQSCRPYNVGSEEAIAIADLARTVASALGEGLEVHIARPAVAGRSPERYVPSVARAREELHLQPHVPLRQAILRTAQHEKATASPVG
jgi:dTDP-glucose 4,6-dehydratase